MKQVTISGRNEEVVDRLIASGCCQDASQAVALSLRLLDQREGKLAALRADIATGMEEVDAGHVEPLDMNAVKRKARERHAQQDPHG